MTAAKDKSSRICGAASGGAPEPKAVVVVLRLYCDIPVIDDPAEQALVQWLTVLEALARADGTSRLLAIMEEDEARALLRVWDFCKMVTGQPVTVVPYGPAGRH